MKRARGHADEAGGATQTDHRTRATGGGGSMTAAQVRHARPEDPAGSGVTGAPVRRHAGGEPR